MHTAPMKIGLFGVIAALVVSTSPVGAASSKLFEKTAANCPHFVYVETSPITVRLFVGETLKARATARCGGGAGPLIDKAPAWSSAKAKIAAVDASGTVVSKSPGTISVVAQIEGGRGTMTVVVKVK